MSDVLNSINLQYTSLQYIYLSEKVSKALTLVGGAEAKETARFTRLFDKFFDALNVSNFSNGKRNRKPFQDPYRSGNDIRLTVSSNKYLLILIIVHLHPSVA